MSTDKQTTTPELLVQLRKNQPRFEGIESGHRACLGCGEALAARLVTEAAGPDVMIANATGCRKFSPRHGRNHPGGYRGFTPCSKILAPSLPVWKRR